LTVRNAKDQRGSRKSEKGVALLLSLLALMLLSAIVAGMFVYANSETLSSYNLKQMEQASYVAEAGVNKALEWLAYTLPTLPSSTFNDNCYPVVQSGAACGAAPILLSAMNGVAANYPDASVQSNFQTALQNKQLGSGAYQGTYAVSATLLRTKPGKTWKLVSRGTSSGGAIVQVDAIVSESSRPLLPPYAMFGCAAVPFSASLGVGGLTDSFNSSAGPYNPLTAGSGGNVGTNGDLHLDGGTIKGDANFGNAPAPNGGLSGAGTITGAQSPLVPPFDCSSIPLPTTSPGTADISVPSGGSQTLSPGSFHNVMADAGGTITLTPGTYNFNALRLDGGPPGARLVITGPTVINIVGTDPYPFAEVVSLDSNTVANSGPPANLQIFVNRPDPVKIGSGSSASMVVVAPKSNITFDSNGSVFGTFFGNTVHGDAGVQAHYDIALQNSLTRGGYQLLSYTRETN
jgi:Tfp pilus assembly protein PilX